MSEIHRFRVFESPDTASAHAAAEIAQLIRERATLGRTAVLGLVADEVHSPLYEELIYLHREEGLSFENVVTFNLNEYLGLPTEHPAGLRNWMYRTFFDHVDIPAGSIHFLSGEMETDATSAHCDEYEEKIEDAGGIDYQILGIGRNGDIGFILPGSSDSSRTNLVPLQSTYRQDVMAFFGELDRVPTHALTMGCGTVLAARKIVMMAWTSKKSRLVRRAIRGPVTPRFPASYLQRHPAAWFYVDTPAGSLLRKTAR